MITLPPYANSRDIECTVNYAKQGSMYLGVFVPTKSSNANKIFDINFILLLHSNENVGDYDFLCPLNVRNVNHFIETFYGKGTNYSDVYVEKRRLM